MHNFVLLNKYHHKVNQVMMVSFMHISEDYIKIMTRGILILLVLKFIVCKAAITQLSLLAGLLFPPS